MNSFKNNIIIVSILFALSCKTVNFKKNKKDLDDVYKESRYYNPYTGEFYIAGLKYSEDSKDYHFDYVKYKNGYFSEILVFNNDLLYKKSNWFDNHDTFIESVFFKRPEYVTIPQHVEMWTGRIKPIKDVSERINNYGYPENSQFEKRIMIFYIDSTRIDGIIVYRSKEFEYTNIDFNKTGDTIEFSKDLIFNYSNESKFLTMSSKMSFFNVGSIYSKKYNGSMDTVSRASVDTIITIANNDRWNYHLSQYYYDIENDSLNKIKFIVIKRETFLTKDNRKIKSENFLYRYDWFIDKDWDLFKELFTEQIANK